MTQTHITYMKKILPLFREIAQHPLPDSITIVTQHQQKPRHHYRTRPKHPPRKKNKYYTPPPIGTIEETLHRHIRHTLAQLSTYKSRKKETL